MSEAPDLQRLLESLPHAEPFRFVSELTALEPRVRATGRWAVTGDESFFAGHFPKDPIVPGVLLAEALAQLCGLVAFANPGLREPPSRPARLAQADVKIHAAIRPPANIELSAVFVRQMGSLHLFEVAAAANGTCVADGRIVLADAQ